MSKTTEILEHLSHIFRAVVTTVSGNKPAYWDMNKRNAKGDQVKWFDMAADQAVCAYLDRYFPYSVNLVSEEGAPRQFGTGTPQFTMILDPVDGSENFYRGLAPSAMAIALIPAEQPIAVDTVQIAFMGNLLTQETWWAARGEGSFYNGRPIYPHVPDQLADLLISCDLNHYIMKPPVNAVLAQAKGVRCLGSAILGLTMVATGACAVHLDPRGTLTPENFLAPALLITEVGGVISDMAGQPLPTINNLTDRCTLLAATTPALHQIVLQELR